MERKIKKLQNRKTIYIVVASVLILLNLLAGYHDGSDRLSQQMPPDMPGKIGYFIGYHFLIIFALFLLLRAYGISKKIKQLEEDLMNEAVDSIGERGDH